MTNRYRIKAKLLKYDDDDDDDDNDDLLVTIR